MKKDVFKSAIVAFVLFVVHMVITPIILNLIKAEGYGYYGLMGGLIYGLIFGFWAYWLFSWVYIQISKHAPLRKTKYVKGLFVLLIGYIVSRVSDIIDRDFINNFNWPYFLMFIVSMPILIETVELLNKRSKI